MGSSKMHDQIRRGMTTAHRIGKISSRHSNVMALHNNMRSNARNARNAIRRMQTAMQRTKTTKNVEAGDYTFIRREIPKPQKSAREMRAREVVGGLSPQQINPVKIRLNNDYKKKYVPPYTVMFHKDSSDVGGTLAFNGSRIRGVTLEDGSEKKSIFSVVSNAGLMPVACPPSQAERFAWGDYVYATSQTVKLGFAKDIPNVCLVEPKSVPGKKNCIGRFCGWPTNNPKDGGILVLLKIGKNAK